MKNKKVKSGWRGLEMGVKISLCLLTVFLLAVAGSVSGSVIYVNESGWWINEFNSSSTPIQSAINYTKSGDTIIVYSGTYNESPKFPYF